MNIRQIVLLVIAISILCGCKKEAAPAPEGISADLTVNAAAKKDTIYLLQQMVTNQLLSPSPVTQTETFTYNNKRQLTKHTVAYKSASSNFTVTYTLIYRNGLVSEVKKSGTQHYPWKKMVYTYNGATIKMMYEYPNSRDSLMVTLRKDTLVRKVQGNGQYYLLDYDAKRNITQRTQYANANPATPTGKTIYTYDNKRSPFWALRDNPYIVFQAFNDVNTHNNNRKSNNVFELYNHTYNGAGYPVQTVVVQSSVARRKIDYTYTTVVIDRK